MEPSDSSSDYTGCRACMKPNFKKNMQFLFDDQLIFEMFNKCTSIDIDKTDNLPSFICKTCNSKLLEFSEFHEMCKTSDSIYRRNMLIKVERLDIGELEPTVHKAIIDLPNLDSIKEVSDDVVSNNQMDSDNNDDGNKPIAPLTNLKKNRTKHRCIVCSKYFQKKHRYDAHMRRHNGLKGYECKLCQNQFVKWSSLARHSKSLHGIIIEVEVNNAVKRRETKVSCKMECEKCGKVFHTPHRMLGHLRIHLGLKPYACDECGVSYAKWSTYKLHINSKHAKETFNMLKCDIEGCNKEYNLKYSLDVHRRRFHNMGEPIPTMSRSICETCGKSFRAPFFLKEHMYTHGPVELYPFGCERCPKRFISKKQLKIHMMRHNKIRNHECPICGMRTTTSIEMKVHVAYHEKNVPYPCEICSNIFQSRIALLRHKRVVHSGRKPYVCTYCNLTFRKSDTWKHHTMRHTGEKPHACTLCERRFIQVVALRTHMKTHNKAKAL